MWYEKVFFVACMALAAVSLWVNGRLMDTLVAQHPELDEEEENQNVPHH